ncbi:DUF6549 family protein [Flavobacterium sp.]|uniref:DUF6549 family protein n=1 Tax=Flavobacterium sp. TaxID=239 RepID=UPI00261E6A87|nr:DUF6549 family protein [Flavobacterium sp.]
MKKYFPYLIAVILAVLLVYQWEKNASESIFKTANLNALTDSVSYYKNQLGTSTASIHTLQLEAKDLKKVILEKDKKMAALTSEFSKVRNIISLKSEASLPPVEIRYEKSVGSDSTQPFKFERTGFNKTYWYSMGYKVTQDSLIIYPLSIPTETTIITGFKRKWLLGRQTLSTDITNSNPYISVQQIKSAEVIIPAPLYKKWYVWLAIGVAGGAIMASN